jgi:hypothetical protein
MPVLAACSVGMALSGEENPDLGAIRVGAARGEVELHLGAPVNSASLDDLAGPMSTSTRSARS